MTDCKVKNKTLTLIMKYANTLLLTVHSYPKFNRKTISNTKKTSLRMKRQDYAVFKRFWSILSKSAYNLDTLFNKK